MSQCLAFPSERAGNVFPCCFITAIGREGLREGGEGGRKGGRGKSVSRLPERESGQRLSVLLHNRYRKGGAEGGRRARDRGGR